MNTSDLRILGMYNHIEKCADMKKKLKMGAALCVFVSLCFHIGASELIIKVVVWIISILGIIGTFVMDAKYAKEIKSYEFKIYALEFEDLNKKKRVAKLKKEVLPDYIIDKKIIAPVDKITYPVMFYLVMLLVDVFIGIVLLF